MCSVLSYTLRRPCSPTLPRTTLLLCITRRIARCSSSSCHKTSGFDPSHHPLILPLLSASPSAKLSGFLHFPNVHSFCVASNFSLTHPGSMLSASLHPSTGLCCQQFCKSLATADSFCPSNFAIRPFTSHPVLQSNFFLHSLELLPRPSRQCAQRSDTQLDLPSSATVPRITLHHSPHCLVLEEYSPR